MRLYVQLVMFLNAILAILAGAAMVLLAYPLPDFSLGRELARLAREGYSGALALGGLALLMLNGVALSRRFFGSYRSKDVPISGSSGEIRVRTAAIEDLLARIGRGNPTVTDARVRVYSLMFGRYRVQCSLAILDSPELHRTVEQVRTRLRERFLDVIPKASRVTVDIQVTGILRDTQRPVVIEGAYPGPQYPVGDEFTAPAPRRPAKK